MNLTKKMWAVMVIDDTGAVRATLWPEKSAALDHASRVAALAYPPPLIFECQTITP